MGSGVGMDRGPGMDGGAGAGVVGPVAGGPVAGGPVADGPVADGSVAGGPVADVPLAGGPLGGRQAEVDNTGSVLKAGLECAARLARRSGIETAPLRGKLLRPFAAFSLVPAARRGLLDERFWLGCLAVQMVHEASLHHDDVLDGGFGRRNGATLLARKGPGAALLAGDIYLTGSYRVALMTGWEEAG